MTEQEIKQRRRQKILARAQQQANKSRQTQPKIQQKVEDNSSSQMSGIKMLEAQKRQNKTMYHIQLMSIFIGILIGYFQLFYLTQAAQIMFKIFAPTILILGIILHILKIKRVNNFAKSNQFLLAKQFNIKYIDFVSKALRLKSNLLPFLKFMSSYCLFIVITNCFLPNQNIK